MSLASSRGSILVAMLCAAALWVACVGDDPKVGNGGGAAVGDYSGKCFDDGKCKEGLVCAQGISCLKAGETIDGGGGATGACTALTSTDQFLDCPLANGGNATCAKATQACCPGAGCVDRATGNCPSGGTKYTCISGPNCASENKPCCISGAFDPTPVCGLSSVFVPSAAGAGQCTDPGLCKSGMLQLCSTGNDCGEGECVPTAIVANGISFVVSACR